MCWDTHLCIVPFCFLLDFQLFSYVEWLFGFDGVTNNILIPTGKYFPFCNLAELFPGNCDRLQWPLDALLLSH